MDFTEKFLTTCRQQNSLVCVGLDTELSKIPAFLKTSDDPIFEFNKAIIDATAPYVAAYKPNLAFYEALGPKGLTILEKTVRYIPEGIVKIADAKRGDIGNTSRLYAKAFFEYFKFDAITISPYLGADSIAPFIEDESKGVFILCLTSNPGSKDFQYFSNSERSLYKEVAQKINSWNVKKNCGLVIGATHPGELKELREMVPDLPVLIPGIGAQGGDLELSVTYGTNKNGELAIFNSSRGIIYKSSGDDFAVAAGKEAEILQHAINRSRQTKF
ncbi:orotidine-5'-phosphate decarboxylase [candidate division KSB1 bacterium]|nr:orotidine-5'-phosphate decarboxylase [candidate division KSB1 bacterium]